MVTRVLKILEMFRTNGPQLAMNEVVGLCGIPKASAFRILETMRESGYLAKNEHQRYRLTYKLLDVAMIVQERNPWRATAAPYLEEIYRISRETVNLGVLQGDHVVYTDVLVSTQLLRISTSVATHASLHATAIGKATLAWLPSAMVSQFARKPGFRRFTEKTITTQRAMREELAQIRERGYAIDNEEEGPGHVCVGAPVFDSRLRLVCGVSISAPLTRMPPDRTARLGELVKETCQKISRKFGFHEATHMP